ncbi:hypothetical protein LINGRAHAP2_LOCUS22008 [Linum grandiflorum]
MVSKNTVTAVTMMIMLIFLIFGGALPAAMAARRSLTAAGSSPARFLDDDRPHGGNHNNR